MRKNNNNKTLGFSILHMTNKMMDQTKVKSSMVFVFCHCRLWNTKNKTKNIQNIPTQNLSHLMIDGNYSVQSKKKVYKKKSQNQDQERESM